MNIFDNSKKYLDDILQKVKIAKPTYLSGKSMAVAFFTKLCPVGCSFCFFRSNNEQEYDLLEKQELSNEGFKKLINFVNNSNIEVLQISGGGEPFEKPEYVVETIKQAKVDKIVLVTSGNWANNYEEAEILLKNISTSINDRVDNLEVVLRISVDKFHISKLGDDKLKNIIDIFEENFKNEENFKLQVHTIVGDDTIDKIMQDLNATKQEYNIVGEINKNQNRTIFTTPSGLNIQVERAKLFLSKIDTVINDDRVMKQKQDVFFRDLNESQEGNFSLYRDKDNNVGLDYLISYNGNVTTWGNYYIHNSPNLYIHSPEEITEKLYTDIISYSFLDKDFLERNNLVREVNSKAADRAIQTNIRDCSGSYMLEENNTALYYAICIVKEYINSGIINSDCLNALPDELVLALQLPKHELIAEYRNSDYNIFTQLKEQPFQQKIWNDIFDLVQKGHYEVSNQQLEQARSYYEQMNATNTNNDDSLSVNPDQQKRLWDKLSPMSEEAQQYLYKSYGINKKLKR